MTTLAKRTRNHTLKIAAAEMAEEAVRGKPMTSVMGKYPAAFPPVRSAMRSALISTVSQRSPSSLARRFPLK